MLIITRAICAFLPMRALPPRYASRRVVYTISRCRHFAADAAASCLQFTRVMLDASAIDYFATLLVTDRILFIRIETSARCRHVSSCRHFAMLPRFIADDTLPLFDAATSVYFRRAMIIILISFRCFAAALPALLRHAAALIDARLFTLRYCYVISLAI